VCGEQGDIDDGSRVYDRNIWGESTGISYLGSRPEWRIVSPRRIPRAADDLARTAAAGLCAAATAGSFVQQPRPSSFLHSTYTPLSLLPIATTTAARNSNNVQQAPLQRLPLQRVCRYASCCQWLRRSPTAGESSLLLLTRRMLTTTAGAALHTFLCITSAYSRRMAARLHCRRRGSRPSARFFLQHTRQVGCDCQRRQPAFPPSTPRKPIPAPTDDQGDTYNLRDRLQQEALHLRRCG
jgi:hypothetical protein